MPVRDDTFGDPGAFGALYKDVDLVFYELGLLPFAGAGASLVISRAAALLGPLALRRTLDRLIKQEPWLRETQRGPLKCSARGEKLGLRVEVECAPNDRFPRQAHLRITIQTSVPNFSAEDGTKPSRNEGLLIDLSEGLVLRGPEAEGVALLLVPLRPLALPGDRVELKDGSLVLDSFDHRRSLEALTALLEGLVRTAEELERQEARLERRLIQHALKEEDPSARVRSLEQLIARFPRSPRLRRAAAIAARDPHVEVRLLAGIVLGPDGRAVLETLLNSKCAGNYKIRAMRQLISQFGKPIAPRLIERLADPLPEVGAAAALSLGALCNEEAIDPLVEASEKRGMLAHTTVAIIEALERIHRVAPERAELALVKLLQHRNPEVQQAAIDALGRVGSASCGGALKRCARALLVPPEVRLAARAALVLLLDRTSSERGSLSLIDPDFGGTLSWPGEPGQLSPTRDETAP